MAEYCARSDDVVCAAVSSSAGNYVGNAAIPYRVKERVEGSVPREQPRKTCSARTVESGSTTNDVV